MQGRFLRRLHISLLQDYIPVIIVFRDSSGGGRSPEMKKDKTLQELTILDDFMFGAVMMEPENCKALLERVLE